MTAIGNSHHPFIATTIGLILNIFLDPLFIFAFDMGVLGAAVATVISQIIVLLMMIYYAKKDTLLFDEVKLKKKYTKPVFSRILKIGYPTGFTKSMFYLYFNGYSKIYCRLW